jgi:hypothetical protein
MSVALSLFSSILIVVAVLVMLRNGKLREKYAILWLVVGGLSIVLALFPSMLEFAADAVGVIVPANLLFALAILLLLGVSLHVSRELTILEDETRILAEEVSILRSAMERSNSTRAAQIPRDGNVHRPNFDQQRND